MEDRGSISGDRPSSILDPQVVLRYFGSLVLHTVITKLMLTDSELMAQVLAVFREEQAEHRQAAAELLLTLERNPDHPQRQALLDRLFREAHSLKGGARAAGQSEVEQIAHRVEDVFSAVRQGRRQITPDLCDPIYAALDAVGTLMNQVAVGQPADLTPHQPRLAALGNLLDDTAAVPAGAPASSASKRAPIAKKPAPNRPGRGKQAPAARHTPNGRPATNGAPAHAGSDSSNGTGNGELPKEVNSSTVRLSTEVLDSLLNEAGELAICTAGAQQQARVAHDLATLPARWRRIWRQAHPSLRRLQARRPTLRPTVHYLDDRDEAQPFLAAPSSNHDTTVLIEALTQANTLIADLERHLGLLAHRLTDDHGRLQAVSDRLHQQIQRTRMLPLATIFSPLRLQMREMARAAGKQVLLELDDADAEADRQVLDRLGEILLHLLRNAVDHGIEPANIRQAGGKASDGLIALRAEASGDHLTLTVADDGAGLDLAAIRQQALASGRASEVDLTRMSEADLIDLIFLPGFSTRQTVSALSGRGVGLDIVRARVERMQGRVTVQNTPGAGCTFTINLPLSLTRSHGLLLRAGNSNYAVPLDAVQQIVQVTAHNIRILEGRPTIVLNDRPLVLTPLTDLLGVAPATLLGEARSTGYGLLLGSGERQILCLVDMIVGEQELVIHRLPMPLQQVPGIAGATILANGKVVPILDVVDLVRAARGIQPTLQLAPATAAPARRATVLVVDDSITTRTLEKNILEAAGYQVHLATDGSEALRRLEQLLESGSCDLILSDVDMPHLNGFELTTRVRADARLQHMPVVLVTSLDTTEDHERGIAAGADAYIIKRQFEQQILLDTIARLI
jgi:two-component system chemotaxis sensor kinase CheA